LLMHDTLDDHKLNEYSAIVLAYIGDAVFELMVREHIVAAGSRKMKYIHHDTVGLVKAESQARAIRQLYEELSEEEKAVAKRGRNAKSTPPKHADVIDYRMSTGFEALLGYLYLKGDKKRLMYLTKKVLDEDYKED